MSFNPTRWQIRAPVELGRKLERLAALADMDPAAYVRFLVECEADPGEPLPDRDRELLR